MKLRQLSMVVMLAVALAVPEIADAGFGGSRGGGGGSRSSFGGGGSRSSFGGSRSAPGRPSSPSFGGSRSKPSAPSYAAPAPSKSSSFGGSRSNTAPAPIVRPSRPTPSYPYNGGYAGGSVNHHYYGGGGYYGGGSGFWHGMAFGYLWNTPRTVYVGGQNVVVDTSGNPVYEDGQMVVYRNTNPVMSFIGTLITLMILGGLIYWAYLFYKKENT